MTRNNTGSDETSSIDKIPCPNQLDNYIYIYI